MPTLYDYPFSGNGYKVRLVLRELGIAYEYRALDILKGHTREPWFLAKNPAGQIPVLELDDGACLSESSAILVHVARGTPLFPSDPLSQTRALQWMCFEQSNIDGVISRARFRRAFPDAIPTRPEEFAAWLSEGHRALAVLEGHLSQREFLVDDAFSIADIALYAYVHCADQGGFSLDTYPALRRWLQRVRSRPAHIAIDDVAG
ncbi:MAG: glutathione S-transferase family protein [Myxococcales bacterium]|nr:glutathione S-transferase family protein [Myxococcales bacterium]